MILHKMIEICLKDDNMHIFVMINALICINNYVITCTNSMLSDTKDILWMDDRVLFMTYESLATWYKKRHILDTTWRP